MQTNLRCGTVLLQFALSKTDSNLKQVVKVYVADSMQLPPADAQLDAPRRALRRVAPHTAQLRNRRVPEAASAASDAHFRLAGVQRATLTVSARREDDLPSAGRNL